MRLRKEKEEHILHRTSQSRVWLGELTLPYVLMGLTESSALVIGLTCSLDIDQAPSFESLVSLSWTSLTAMHVIHRLSKNSSFFPCLIISIEDVLMGIFPYSWTPLWKLNDVAHRSSGTYLKRLSARYVVELVSLLHISHLSQVYIMQWQSQKIFYKGLGISHSGNKHHTTIILLQKIKKNSYIVPQM